MLEYIADNLDNPGGEYLSDEEIIVKFKNEFDGNSYNIK